MAKKPNQQLSEQTNAQIDESLFPDQDSLANAEDIWAGGQEEAAKSRPTGTMICEIVAAELGRSASSDRLQITYKLAILGGGEGEPQELFKYDGLGTPQQASITQNQLARIGLKAADLSLKQLPAALLAVVGKRVVVTAKQNGEFYNVNFVKLAGENVAGKPSSTVGGAARKPVKSKGTPF